MSVALNPYLSFKDNAREAMEFYRSVFGGELSINTFAEFHAAVQPSENELVMHSQLTGENGIVFMGSDTPPRTCRTSRPPGSACRLSGDDDELLSSYFSKLSETGTVRAPLGEGALGVTSSACASTSSASRAGQHLRVGRWPGPGRRHGSVHGGDIPRVVRFAARRSSPGTSRHRPPAGSPPGCRTPRRCRHADAVADGYAGGPPAGTAR